MEDKVMDVMEVGTGGTEEILYISEGLSTSSKVIIGAGILVAAAAAGYGIYRFAQSKKKSPKEKTRVFMKKADGSIVEVDEYEIDADAVEQK